MTITEAQKLIDEKLAAGLISEKEAGWHNRMIRRTGDYGNNWSWSQQKRKRANLMEGF